MLASISMEDAVAAPTADFQYLPPPAAIEAAQILVKPNLGYPVGPPATVSLAVLQRVLQGLRSVNPRAEILIVEGVCSKVSFLDIMSKLGVYLLLDDGMQVLDADALKWTEYPNLSPAPVRFRSMWAPQLLKTVDCRISVGGMKRTMLKGEALISASLKNLYGLFPREKYKARSPNSRGQLHRPSVPAVLQDVYFSVGHWFDGAVVDCDQKFVSRDWQPDKGSAIAVGQVIWGSDLLAVDRLACQLASEPMAPYLEAIANLRSQCPHELPRY